MRQCATSAGQSDLAMVNLDPRSGTVKIKKETVRWIAHSCGFTVADAGQPIAHAGCLGSKTRAGTTTWPLGLSASLGPASSGGIHIFSGL